MAIMEFLVPSPEQEQWQKKIENMWMAVPYFLGPPSQSSDGNFDKNTAK